MILKKENDLEDDVKNLGSSVWKMWEFYQEAVKCGRDVHVGVSP